ncbi:MAG: hypothetical protein ACLU3G_04850 [Christensenellales bacterium]
MDKTLQKTKLFPSYAYLPLIITVLLHMAIYWGTKAISGNAVHHSIPVSFEDAIPFAPEWVTIYTATFIFWMLGLAVCMTRERELCFRMFTGLYMAELICAVFFIALPTVIDRPEVTGGVYYDRLLAQLYSADQPVNLFPSMHCMFAYMVFRGFMIARLDKPVVIGSGLFAALVCASTVFVKQHFLLDTFAGIILGEVAVTLSLKTNAWKLMDKIHFKLLRLLK